MNEKEMIAAMIVAANTAIKNLSESEVEVLDDVGNPVSAHVVAIVASTTLAGMYAVQAGISRELFVRGLASTYDAIRDSYDEAVELLQEQGETKWVQ
jgi:hypothetical protein